MHIRDLFSLKDRVAIITGATERLGYHSAEGLAEAGATVIVTSRDKKKAEEAAAKLSKSTGGRVEGAALDPADETQVARFIQDMADRHGRIDVLVNNASGRGLTPETGAYAYGHPEDHPLEHWDYTMRANLTSAFLCLKHALPIMKKQGSGSIINMSSIAAVVGRDRWVYDESKDMIPVTSDYSAAKAGVIGLTLDMAAQVGESGIRVNALLPGGFRRDEHPAEFVKRYSSHTMLNRMGEFDRDLKGAVLFLASDASRYVTGQQLIVDGGFVVYR
jgi:NAD(P)-dependent dehydrogenase (short-subunit alcohol dehydrogenase family)